MKMEQVQVEVTMEQIVGKMQERMNILIRNEAVYEITIEGLNNIINELRAETEVLKSHVEVLENR